LLTTYGKISTIKVYLNYVVTLYLGKLIISNYIKFVMQPTE